MSEVYKNLGERVLDSLAPVVQTKVVNIAAGIVLELQRVGIKASEMIQEKIHDLQDLLQQSPVLHMFADQGDSLSLSEKIKASEKTLDESIRNAFSYEGGNATVILIGIAFTLFCFGLMQYLAEEDKDKQY